MSEKQYYTAIDLGTTNSVIAYGNIQNNVMRPIVLELDRKNDMGSKSRNPLLPSVVFYYKNNEGKIVTDIGDYAKSRYGTRAGYVCKSVKSLMGTTDQVPLVEEIPDKTPSDVSAQILSFMVKSAFINLNDMDLYGLLKRTDAYIRNWEMVNAYQTILQGQQAYAQYLSTVRQQNQQRQAPGYPQENPAYTGDQYEQRPSDNYGQSQYQYSEPQYQYNNPNY